MMKYFAEHRKSVFHLSLSIFCVLGLLGLRFKVQGVRLKVSIVETII